MSVVLLRKGMSKPKITDNSPGDHAKSTRPFSRGVGKCSKCMKYV